MAAVATARVSATASMADRRIGRRRAGVHAAPDRGGVDQGRGVRIAIVLVALLVATFAIGGGIGQGTERDLRTMRAGWREHAASGNVVVVEVDARSIAALDHWPWPRRYLAQALDRIRAGHARSVAFDVDFSSRSTPADDALFAAALKRSGGAVILPTFTQSADSRGAQMIDTLPLPAFRPSAFIAGVNVQPDGDGVVRSYPLSIVTRGVTRPSIGAMLAETSATGGTAFPIDYAIDPDTIPRISFVDLLQGRVAPDRIAGKRIMIGATAIEIGDRYAVPGRGVVPGVVVQALATETLMAKGARTALGPLPLALLALAAISVLTVLTGERRRLVGLAVILAMPFLIALPLDAAGWEADIVPAMLATIGALSVAGATMLLRELRNRRFVDLDSGLANARALEQAAAGTPAIDLFVARIDRLTEMTAALGHRAATTALLQIADRLGAATGCTIYRVEDDALAWIGGPADDEHNEEDIFRRLTGVLKAPVEVGGIPVEARAAFGVAGGAGTDAKDLIAGAQIAARRVRARGGVWDRFASGDSDAARWELSLLGAFGEAIRNGEIWVAYQPKVGAADGMIQGSEALVRWRHPARGLIPPDAFIPLVEREGRTVELTAFVLDTAVSDLARWHAAGHRICVAVNLSATLLHDPALVPMVADAVARAGIDPATLTLELTESAIISDAEAAIGTLEKLRALGVKLSIDDYGTGQSTLTYLRRFPAAELKIDKSFIQNIVRNGSDRLLVRSTIELAHAMGMTVVAEGVEDEECLQALRAIGCDTIQGWHTGKPMPFDDFTARLATDRRTDAIAA